MTKLSQQVSLHLATIVILEVDKILADNRDLTVNYYENGREHGFTIKNERNSAQVSFAEHRSSDDVIVYFGNSGSFNEDGSLTEKAYESNKNMKHYKGDEDGCKRAAKFISTFLK